MMAESKERRFGQVIHDRRRQLDLTRQEIARRIKTSTPYVGHLESSRRHPSDKVLRRLAEVLELNRRELSLLANPRTMALLRPNETNTRTSAWEEFRKDERIHRIHNIKADEIEMLSTIALMGEISSPQDFVYILQMIRRTLGR
jgi:transcriptional regulator with XRE-family HTH domain